MGKPKGLLTEPIQVDSPPPITRDRRKRVHPNPNQKQTKPSQQSTGVGVDEFATKPEGTNAPEPPEWSSRVAAISDDIASAGQRGAKRKGTANEDDWEEFLAVLFGFGSVLYAMWLVSDTGAPRSERESLELTEDEASAFARPLARIMARSWVNKSYGKHILGGSDYIALAVAMVVYVERTSPYLRRKISFNTARITNRRANQTEQPNRQEVNNRNGELEKQADRPAANSPFIVGNMGT